MQRDPQEFLLHWMVQKDEENFQEYLLLCFFNQNLHRSSRANQWGSEGGATTAEVVATFGGN